MCRRISPVLGSASQLYDLERLLLAGYPRLPREDCSYIWECMPNSPACWMEMPGENWVPYVSVSRYLLAHISLFTILFNMLSITDPRIMSFEIWVFMIFSLHFCVLCIPISSTIVDLLCLLYHSSCTIWICIQDCMPRISCCLLCHRINIVKM